MDVVVEGRFLATDRTDAGLWPATRISTDFRVKQIEARNFLQRTPQGGVDKILN
jgi:hypothetical protein